MSTKTIIEQLAEAQGIIASLTAERDTFKAAFAASEDQAKHNAETVLKLEADALAAKESAEKLISETAAKLEAEATARKEAEQAQANTAAELAKAKAALANPAFADAAITGAKPIADSVGSQIKSTLTYPEFQKLSQAERMKFSVNGGRITD